MGFFDLQAVAKVRQEMAQTRTKQRVIVGQENSERRIADIRHADLVERLIHLRQYRHKTSLKKKTFSKSTT
jgi:hypothetical protein